MAVRVRRWPTGEFGRYNASDLASALTMDRLMVSGPSSASVSQALAATGGLPRRSEVIGGHDLRRGRRHRAQPR